MTRLKADGLLLLTAALWGFSFVMQKTAMASVGPMSFMAARCALAVAVLTPFAIRELRRQTHMPPVRFWRLAGLTGTVFFCGSALQQIGLQTATVTNASFLTALYCVFVPIILWVVFGLRPGRAVWLAVVLSIAGTWLLGGGTLSALTQGDGLIAVCAVFWGLHIVLTGQAIEFNHPLLFTALQFVVTAALSLAGAATFETPSFAALSNVWVETAYVGIVSSALCFAMFTIAMRHAPPSEAAILLSTENLFAALAGAVVLGERLAWINWLGAALILTAILVVQLAPGRGDAARR